MCRAGSDIGYCDSDHRENGSPMLSSEADVTKHLVSMGFEVEDVRVGDDDLDIYINYEGVAYEFIDLTWDDYDNFSQEDYLKGYDNIYSMCCGADYNPDFGRCASCKEGV